MKILIIEDSPQWQKDILSKIGSLGETHLVKSFKGAQKAISQTEWDIIICDHHIQFWEDSETKPATGNQVYQEYKRKYQRSGEKTNTIFIHYSSNPSTKKEYSPDDDSNFYSFHKTASFDLKKTILKILKKDNL